MTNSAPLAPMTSERVTRAYAGHDTMSIAMTAFVRLGPSAAAMTIARMIVGNANTRSAIRMMVSSRALPK